MVSQPELSNPLTVRGASSVVSRPSLSSSSRRTKRYNRSHTGAASHVSQNDFPVFTTSGDVEIIVRAGSSENRYLLHRHTLTRSSGFFEASTSTEWSKARPPLLAGGNELARIGEEGLRSTSSLGLDEYERNGGPKSGTLGPRKRWRYELDTGPGNGDIPMLVQREESRFDVQPPTSSLFGKGVSTSRSSHSRTKDYQNYNPTSSSSSTVSASNHSFFRSVANLSLTGHHPPQPTSQSKLSQTDQDLLRDYDNLFRIFYNHPPILDGVNVADAYVQCKSLLNLADQYDALPVVGARVDHHLLQFQSRLWKQIAKYPISYLKLAYLARSKVIFQEALIHVVGQWPVGERSLRAVLPDIVLDIIEDKVDELEETVSRIEGRLFRLNLSTSRGERVDPHTNYLDWLSNSLFRQWLADNTSPQPAPIPNDRRRPGSHEDRVIVPPVAPSLPSLGRTYRALGSGNSSSFLGHDECKRFLKLTPEFYSRENLRRFEKRVDELKVMARGIVGPLMSSQLELDMGGTSRAADGIQYLTCTSVGSRDLPWQVDE